MVSQISMCAGVLVMKSGSNAAVDSRQVRQASSTSLAVAQSIRQPYTWMNPARAPESG